MPVSAIMQTNGITNPAAIRPGQRLVIPRYVYDAPHAPHVLASAPAPKHAAENVHIVAPGEGLIGIARRNGITLAALARANNIQPYTKLKVGDRLTVPGGGKVAARHAPAPKVAAPRTVAPRRRSRASRRSTRAWPSRRCAKTKSITHKAEPAGGIPSFRWPVKGRIIAGFGPRPNGIAERRHQSGGAGRHADQGRRRWRRRLCRQRAKGYGNLVLVRHVRRLRVGLCQCQQARWSSAATPSSAGR